ncbi:MAG: adenine phosphoribosyltransferase [Candidatus Omnitrophica bacterium]|nr:adenine phosphoribosyltransferase [Candidatus Omnitrophota bacterium]
MDLDKVIRKVPDFPKPGILFYDITSLFADPRAFNHVLSEMESLYADTEIDGVIAIESRGFLLGAPYAAKKSLPLVLARKEGKLPGDTVEQSYSLEYGEATLEIHKEDLALAEKWLIVDDLIATGGTLKAVALMIERNGGEVAGMFSIIGLPFLNYMEDLEQYGPETLIDYEGE